MALGAGRDHTSTVATTAVSRAHLTVVRGARLFDGTRPVPLAAPTVVIDGSRITAVGVPVPEHAAVVDLPGTTLLPGLVDTHVHLAFDASADPIGTLAAWDDTAALAAMTGAARTAARAGITTVRDLGDRCFLALVLRDRAEPGLPTIVASGPPLTTPGGHCHYLGGESSDVRATVRATPSGASTSSRSWPAVATSRRAAAPSWGSSSRTSCAPRSTRRTGSGCRSRPTRTGGRPSSTRSRPVSTGWSTSRS
jgi:imidazolonepropionase-like amidohydrolase